MTQSPGDQDKIKLAIIHACRTLGDAGVNQGTSGNVSVRFGNEFLITPSGLDYATMRPDDIVRLSINSRQGDADHPLSPSSEWRFHRDILVAHSDVSAIVHAHPTYATALAIQRQTIPAIHYMIAAAGGPTIRCADYATFGTQKLSDNVLKAIEGRKACLLANHGLIVAEMTLDKAVWLAIEVETLAKQFTYAKLLGDPKVLPDSEIVKVIKKFRSYGLQSGK